MPSRHETGSSIGRGRRLIRMAGLGGIAFGLAVGWLISWVVERRKTPHEVVLSAFGGLVHLPSRPTGSAFPDAPVGPPVS